MCRYLEHERIMIRILPKNDKIVLSFFFFNHKDLREDKMRVFICELLLLKELFIIDTPFNIPCSCADSRDCFMIIGKSKYDLLKAKIVLRKSIIDRLSFEVPLRSSEVINDGHNVRL